MTTTLIPRERRPQKIAILPGDGIGVDVTKEAIKVLEAVSEHWSLPLEPVTYPWSANHYLETGESLPDGALEELRSHFSAILIGAYGDPRVPDMKHAADILLGIRFGLDLYVNFRPVKLYDNSMCPLAGKTTDDVDFVVFRENTEGAYVGVGGIFKRGTEDEIAVQEELNTRRGVERIVPRRFRLRPLQRPRQGLYGGQIQHHAIRSRSVAAVFLRGCRRVPGHRRQPPLR